LIYKSDKSGAAGCVIFIRDELFECSVAFVNCPWFRYAPFGLLASHS